MVAYGELVMVETNGPEDMDMGIGLTSNLILREDGKILSPDAHVNPLGEHVPSSDIIDTIAAQIAQALDSVDSQAVDEMSQQIEEKIEEMADSSFDTLTDLLVQALTELANSKYEILNQVNLTSLAQDIADAIIQLLVSAM